jgi:hypothetical protein
MHFFICIFIIFTANYVLEGAARAEFMKSALGNIDGFNKQAINNNPLLFTGNSPREVELDIFYQQSSEKGFPPAN